jgi:hypothetical protein
MITANREMVEVDHNGIATIVAAHAAEATGLPLDRLSVLFKVGTRSGGQGMGEYDYAVMENATVEFKGDVVEGDLLRVISTRRLEYAPDDIKEAVALYVSKARGIPVGPDKVELKLSKRNQGDRGGWQGPSLDKAVVTIELK